MSLWDGCWPASPTGPVIPGKLLAWVKPGGRACKSQEAAGL